MQPDIIPIQLKGQEQRLFSLLLKFTQQNQLKTVMRVAGGWVRDKLMGKQSNDIDIALDNVTGEVFLTKLIAYAKENNQPVSGFGVTRINPDLSKHLQTATAQIYSQKIDFVNLRKEDYALASNGNEVQEGTPLSDAMRRDFTVNSLFYNINSVQVEDWTQKGIIDLNNKVIRTPLPPLETFQDDPLRVLRCFRFKARLGFSIHKDILESLSSQELHKNLRTKVSKERLGIQLAGMLKTQHPLQSLSQILKYDFWNIVFQISQKSDIKDPLIIQKIPLFSYKLIQEGLKSFSVNSFITQKKLLLDKQTVLQDKRERYGEQQLTVLIRLAMLTAAYRKNKVIEGKKSSSLIDHMVRIQLKYSAKVAKFCTKIGDLIIALQQLLRQRKQNWKARVARWLRQAQQKWQIVLHIMHALHLMNEASVQVLPFELRGYIVENGLEDSYLIEAFVDGHFLLKRGKKGPIVGTIMNNIILWRILNPSVSKQEFLELYQKNETFFQTINPFDL